MKMLKVDVEGYPGMGSCLKVQFSWFRLSCWARRNSCKQVVIGLARQIVQGVPQKIDITTLPAHSGQLLPDLLIEPRMDVADHQLNPAQPVFFQLH